MAEDNAKNLAEPDHPDFSTYFKYCSDRVVNHIFKRKKIRFTQPWALNDPLEFNPSIRFNRDGDSAYRFYDLGGIILASEELWYRGQIIESQINEYGMLSLSKKHASFDMWSRYANGHKGFVIEFKEDLAKRACMRAKNGDEYPLEKVTYVHDYAINLDELAEKYADENGRIPLDKLHEEFFYKKTARWQDEDEYRLVRPLTDSPDYRPRLARTPHRDEKRYLFDFSLDCIESIIFGAHMSPGNKQLIESSCRSEEVKFLQSYIMRDEKDESGKPGKVLYGPLDDFGSRSVFYRMPPQTFCTDLSKPRPLEPKKITEIGELPYYAGNEELVDEFYRMLRDSGGN